MSDSDSDSDSQFASPQSITPIHNSANPSRAQSPGPPLHPSTKPPPSTTIVNAAAFTALKPPPFSPTPEKLPPEPSPDIDPVPSDALSKAKTALDSLSKILTGPLPSAIISSPNPALAALYDGSTSYSISCLLRAPNSGSGDNPLCRWLYDTFQTNDPFLELLVLRFVPLLAGVYLARASSQRRHLAGFEAVLLALYANVTNSRASQPVSVSIPDLSNPSVYHESALVTAPVDPMVAIVTPPLEPHGTVRSTRRASIVGVALDLYFGKICFMPLASKVEFCEFCDVWAGHAEDPVASDEERIALPWELLQPTLRILGHFLVGPSQRDVLHDKARNTCKKLYARALHDMNPKAILATESLIRMIKIEEEDNEIDYTEVPDTRVISV